VKKSLLMAVLLAARATAQVPPLQCEMQTSDVASHIRAEGQAELVTGLMIYCMGASTVKAAVTVDISVSLNTNFASPPSGSATDAVLLINDPNGSYQSAPLQPGVNMFRGTRESHNTVRFIGIPVPVPEQPYGTALRITNLRADASTLATGTQVVAYVSATPSDRLSLHNPEQLVAYVQPAYKAELRTPAGDAFAPFTLDGAIGLNSGLRSGSGTGAIPQYLVSFSEGFVPSSFRPRSQATAGDPVAPQNDPDNVYMTETGFYDPSLSSSGSWNTVGLAHSGTRLMARFSGIPAGVSLFVSATPWPVASTTIFASDVRLTAANSNGAGPYSPVTTAMTVPVNGVAVPVAGIPLAGGTGTAVWEITGAPPQSAGTFETYNFAVFLAYAAGTMTGQLSTIEAGLAPLDSAGISIVPRFSSAQTQKIVATIPPALPPPDVSPALSISTTNIAPGGPIAGIASVRNQGHGPTLGPSKLRIQVHSATGPVGTAFDCPIIGGLPSGSSSTGCAWSLTAPLTTGTYFVRATADADTALAESDKTNNVRTLPVTVAPCRWSLSPQVIVLDDGRNRAFVRVETSNGCENRIEVPDAPWMRISQFPAAGPGIVDIFFQSNTGATRSATFTIAGETVTVWQAAAGCRYTLSPAYAAVSSQGDTKTFQVSTSAGCPWMPLRSDNANWLAVSTPGTVQTGPGRIDITFAKNSGDQRVAVAGILNQPTTIMQFAGNDTTAPIGFWDTPSNAATNVTGAIPVTGWALDNTYVSKVQIWRDPVAGEPAAPVYIGDATFVNGARPDVAAQYPSMPYNTRAGWGYQLLTNMLPNADGSAGKGNGTYTLRATAFDDAGNSVSLGSRTITCTNAAAVKPFGTIDTPASGETISGVYVNFGWALTPMPHNVPVDGSTIWVYVDGKRLAHPTTYGNARADIVSSFPGYTNTNTAVGRIT
jgi:hypothetical protein